MSPKKLRQIELRHWFDCAYGHRSNLEDIWLKYWKQSKCEIPKMAILGINLLLESLNFRSLFLPEEFHVWIWRLLRMKSMDLLLRDGVLCITSRIICTDFFWLIYLTSFQNNLIVFSYFRGQHDVFLLTKTTGFYFFFRVHLSVMAVI